MKKRNQLVSAMLAGFIIGGLASTTVWADDDQLNQNQAVVAAETEASATNYSEGSSSGDSGKSSSEGSSDHGSQASSGSTSTAAPSTPATPAAQDPGTTPAAPAETPSETPAETPGEAPVDPTTPSETPADPTNPDQPGETPEDPTNPDQPGENPEDPTNPDQPGETPEAPNKPAEAPKGGDDQKGQSSSNQGSSRQSGGSSSYRYGATAAVLTEEQKIQNLKAGFKKVAKNRAVVIAPDYLRVREGKGLSSRIIGTIKKDGLLYILADEDQEWVYVESGDVRGFVLKKWILTGEEAEKAVEKLGGEEKLPSAKQIIGPLENQAFRYSLNTTYDVPTYYGTATTATRAAIIAYAETFLGGRYVWGGEDPNTGADCSGYVGYVYRHFGINLPRTSYQQCDVGKRIEAREAKPGDLIFYARNGVVYHVLMYIGDGKAVNAQSSATGIVISDVDYNKACWACSYINDETTSTQAAALLETGRKAYEGDAEAQRAIIEALAKAADKEWTTQGFAKSVLIAQVIQESGWLSFAGAADGGIQPEDNNILGMNQELLNDQWVSPWTGKVVNRNVPQYVNGQTVMGIEPMRAYEDIEACLEDYAAFKIGLHPDLKGSTDIDQVVDIGLKGYATDPGYQSSIKRIIEKYDLTKYDTMSMTGLAQQAGNGAVDATAYTQDQLELIWAIVAQEDDGSYDGALAVITSAMNRADQNYGGFGQNALAQLTADGQYCYSPKVSNPAFYQRRLGGNVADFVKQAVSDCLTKGVRNHSYVSFRGSNGSGREKIGANYYFND